MLCIFHAQSQLTTVGNGVQLLLNVEEREYIESADSSDLGFMLLVHHQSEPPFTKEFGFGLTPGFHYLIGMRMVEVSLAAPSNCFLVQILYDFTALARIAYQLNTKLHYHQLQTHF